MKKCTVLVFALVVSFSLFAGGQKEYKTEVISEVRPGCEKHYDISIGWWGIQNFLNGEDDAILKKIEEEFNISIVGKNTTWSDWQEKYRLWAAAGELPDVFADDIVNTNDYFHWIKQGIIRALPQDLSPYPQLESIMKMKVVTPLKQKDGKFYLFPRLKQYDDNMTTMARGILVRKDWMQKLGFDEPETFKEFYTMSKAFVTEDPDGNGKDDTVGITVRNKHYILIPFLASNPNLVNWSWRKDDGQWVPAFASKEMETGLRQMDKLYEDGILDPDLGMLKGDDGLNKFTQGKAGIMFTQTTPGMILRVKEMWEDFNDTPFSDAVGIIHIYEAQDGIRYRHTEKPFWSSSYFRGDLEDEKLDRILKLYNYLLSDEGLELLQYGIKDVDYEKNGDSIVLKQIKDMNGEDVLLSKKYPSIGLFYGLPSWFEFNNYKLNEINMTKYGEKIMTMVLKSLDWKMKNTKPIPTNYDILMMYTPNKSKFEGEFFIDDIMKVLLSKDDIVEEWNTILEEYDAKGLNAAIKEVNEEAEKMGL